MFFKYSCVHILMSIYIYLQTEPSNREKCTESRGDESDVNKVVIDKTGDGKAKEGGEIFLILINTH